MATDLKLSKAQIKKLIQSGGFLGKLLSKLAGPLMKAAMLLAKNVLAPLGLTTAMSAIDGSIQKKMRGEGVKLVIEQEDMNDIMNIIEALENSDILLKGEIKANIFRSQAYDSIMCGYFCIEFINYMFNGKSLINFTSLFSPHDFKKNDQIIKRIFKNE